jgi:hypothetical protein
MKFPDFSIEDLKQLPLRAMVAFAVRCARRVEPLAQLPESDGRSEPRRVAIAEALRLAEAAARGDACPSAEAVVQAIDASCQAADVAPHCASAAEAAAQAAHAAASLLTVMERAVEDQELPQSARNVAAQKFLGSLESTTADLTAMSAYTAAAEAYYAVGLANDDFMAASLNDYDTLTRLKLGRYPEPGEPIDPSPGGPLGAIRVVDRSPGR